MIKPYISLKLKTVKLGVTGTDILTKKISGGSKHQKEVLLRLAKNYELVYFPDPIIYSSRNDNKTQVILENAKFFEDNGVKITDAFYSIIHSQGKKKFDIMNAEIKITPIDTLYNLDYQYALYNGLSSGYMDYTQYLSKLLDVNYGACIQGLGDINNHLLYSFYSFSYLSAKMGKYFFYPLLAFAYDYIYIKVQLKRLTTGKMLKFISLVNLSQRDNIKIKTDVPLEILHPSNGFCGNPEMFSKKENKIIYYSRLNFMKGIFEIPYIFKKIREKMDINLEIIGRFNTDYEKEEFFKTVHRLGIEKSVNYTGYLTDSELQTELGSSLLLLYPSHSDSFSLVILESLSLGVPVIAYNIPGLSYFRNFSNVKMVKEFDIDAMASASLEMLENLNFREFNEAELSFFKMHTWDKVAMEHSKLIDKYLN